MEIKAHAKFVRLSPRKARLIVDTVRGQKALDAQAQLRLMPQKAAHEVYKLIATAMANAEHNFGLSKNDLLIKEIVANQGPTFKRYKPRARGSADTIRRKMTHLSIVLISESGAKPKVMPKSKPEIIKEEPAKKQAEAKKPQTSKEVITKPKEEKIKEAKKTVTKPAQKTLAKKEKPEPVKEAKPRLKHEVKREDHSFFGGIKRFFRRRGE